MNKGARNGPKFALGRSWGRLELFGTWSKKGWNSARRAEQRWLSQRVGLLCFCRTSIIPISHIPYHST